MDSFSINGKYLKTIEDSKEFLNPIIFVDKKFHSRMVYGNVIGKVTIVKLPYFDQPDVKPWIEKSSVTPLLITPDKRNLIYFNLGLWWIGDFKTNIPSENKESKGIIDLMIRRK